MTGRVSVVGALPPLDRARALSRSFAETAAHYDRTGEFPFSNFDALSNAGLLSLTVDHRFGGDGAGLGEAIGVIRTIARGEPATALVLAMHYIQHAGIQRSGRWPAYLAERVARESLTGIALINGIQVERQLGSPSRGGLPETIALQHGDFWRISGHKIYSTGAPILKYLNVLARTDEDSPRIGSFLVPAATPGIRIVETWDQLGMRATASHDIIFDDVAIPLDHAIDLKPAGTPPDPAYGAGRAWFLGLVASVYDGVAQSARDWLVEFLLSRTPSGLNGASLATVPRIQEAVGAIEAKLQVNDSLLRDLGREVDDGLVPSLGRVGIVKSMVTNNAIEITTAALRLSGNNGTSLGNPLERHHRDALCGQIHAPQDDTIFAAAGRAVLGL